MEICIIFAEKLYAIKYSGDKINVYRKLIEQWTDIEYLYNFLPKQRNDIDQNNIYQIIENIIEDVNKFDEILIKLSESKERKINEFFIPLSPSEYRHRDLSLQKGRVRNSYSRIYAIKIDDNCFIITGGALKFTRTMQERIHTNKELINLNKVKDFLKSENIIDKDSFYELYNEIEDENNR